MGSFFSIIAGVIVSVVSGAVGYVFATFYIRPILRYCDLKHQLIVDLIVYANAVNPEGYNDFIKEHHEKRVIALRTHSAEFLACYEDLPKIFKKLLNCRNEDPGNAADNLMVLSNTTDYEDAHKQVDKIKKHLNISISI